MKESLEHKYQPAAEKVDMKSQVIDDAFYTLIQSVSEEGQNLVHHRMMFEALLASSYAKNQGEAFVNSLISKQNTLREAGDFISKVDMEGLEKALQGTDGEVVYQALRTGWADTVYNQGVKGIPIEKRIPIDSTSQEVSFLQQTIPEYVTRPRISLALGLKMGSLKFTEARLWSTLESWKRLKEELGTLSDVVGSEKAGNVWHYWILSEYRNAISELAIFRMKDIFSLRKKEIESNTVHTWINPERLFEKLCRDTYLEFGGYQGMGEVLEKFRIDKQLSEEDARCLQDIFFLRNNVIRDSPQKVDPFKLKVSLVRALLVDGVDVANDTLAGILERYDGVVNPFTYKRFCFTNEDRKQNRDLQEQLLREQDVEKRRALFRKRIHASLDNLLLLRAASQDVDAHVIEPFLPITVAVAVEGDQNEQYFVTITHIGTNGRCAGFIKGRRGGSLGTGGLGLSLYTLIHGYNTKTWSLSNEKRDRSVVQFQQSGDESKWNEVVGSLMRQCREAQKTRNIQQLVQQYPEDEALIRTVATEEVLKQDGE